MISSAAVQEWFDSPYYHKLYFEGETKTNNGFFEKLTDHLQPVAGSRILHTACGKGSGSRTLASMGFEVTAVDASPLNIEAAINAGNDNPEFFIHDMRLPFRGSYFDIALCAFTGFGHYRTRREHEDMIRTMATSLRPGGKLVIDYPNAHYLEDHLQHNQAVQKDGTSFEIHRWNNENSFFSRITVRERSLAVPEVFTEQLAKFSPGDFNDMLSFQGMQITDLFGDYDLNPYHVRAMPRLIVIAKRL